jgi:phosphoglucosamine mutase
VIGNQPNGLNINDESGTTHPQALQKAVVEHQADLGIAFDGDGDRVMMVDSEGRLLEGDQLLYIITTARQQQGTLQGGIVGTLMTNLAVEHKFANMHIPFTRAKVGDRYVMELLNQHGWQLGGENSGHILTLDKHSSGDGIVAALQVLEALIQSKQTLAQLSASLVMYPQVLINIRTDKKINVDQHTDIQAAIVAAEKDLAGTGRVLLRSSGTEPIIRVMVEGENQKQVETLAQRIADVVVIATSG